MPVTLDRLQFAPPPPPGMLRALALALLAHLLLMAALTWGINWNSDPVTLSADAELWSRVPQEAAPALVTPPPPVPTPAPIPLPVPPPPAPPVETVKPPAPPEPSAAARDAEIALEREREREKEIEKERLAAEKRKQLALEKKREEAKEREKERERELVAKKKREEAQELEARRKEDEARKKQLAKTRAAEEKKLEARKEEAEKKAKLAEETRRAEAQREANLARIKGLAGATGAPTATGEALRSSGPSSSYAGRIVARVKPNIVFGEDIVGNPKAEVEVKTAPDGTIVGQRIVKSSGVASWDEAVLKALIKTQVLPRDTDGRVPPSLIIEFRPKG